MPLRRFTPPALPPGAVHVWRLNLDEAEPFDAVCLAPDELERAARFAF